jgi:pimeloyl-ACP methyl ester carboxylesterase
MLDVKLWLFLMLQIGNGMAHSQTFMTSVYFFPGTGSDERLFSKIALPTGFEAKYILYPVPNKKQSMASYASLLAQQIDTTQPFVLIGTSIGGMLCTELTEQLQPLKTIIISSAKCRSELPRHYRFQRYIPINKLFGPRAIKALSPIAQAVVEPDRNKHKATFKAMLNAKHPKFLKRAVHMIINWKRTGYDKNIVHVHGSKDHTLPLRNISPSIIINGGSHMMTLTMGEHIGALIGEILVNLQP